MRRKNCNALPATAALARDVLLDGELQHLLLRVGRRARVLADVLPRHAVLLDRERERHLYPFASLCRVAMSF